MSNAELYSANSYTFVDSIPEVAAARRAERERAEAVLSSRSSGLAANANEAVLPPPVDALSTAVKVHEAARVHGEGSPEHAERMEGLVLDCSRLVAEWYRKLKPEWFPAVRHFFDSTTEEFFSHGLSVRQMTENALLPMPDNPEEEARRVNERVEDETPNILRRCLGGTALKGAAIRTISECTDKAIGDHEADVRNGNNRRKGYGGYVPEIAKLAVRDIKLDEETGDRFEEQVLLPGEYLTHGIILQALKRKGLTTDNMSKTDLHGAQILACDGLMDFVRTLDEVASKEWCTNVFMGEEVPKDFVKDYSAFQEEAANRQEDQRDMALTVANFVLDLAVDDVDRRHAPLMVEEFVKTMLLNAGKKDPEAAKDMFDEKTAQGLREVAALEAAGRHSEAYIKFSEVEKAAPGGGYCGAGSCGIESFDERGDRGKYIKSRLKAGAGDILVKDNKRSCKKCGETGALYYAYSAKKVNKFCEKCEATEYKSTSSRA